jgi:CRISPR system Cascade subunit CasE
VTGWLTRITLETRHRAVRTDLADAVAMHRRLMSLLPNNLGTHARAQTSLLYRLDHQRPGAAILLTQSTVQPDINQLPNGYGIAEQRLLTPMLDALAEGMLVRYRLAANASKRLWKGDEHHPAGKVVALGKADAEQWWRDRAQQRHGLQILAVHTEAADSARGRRNHATVTHAITRFDGTALITDAHALRNAILEGIGRGKTYGCGLLSLARART